MSHLVQVLLMVKKLNQLQLEKTKETKSSFSMSNPFSLKNQVRRKKTRGDTEIPKKLQNER